MSEVRVLSMKKDQQTLCTPPHAFPLCGYYYWCVDTAAEAVMGSLFVLNTNVTRSIIITLLL